MPQPEPAPSLGLGARIALVAGALVLAALILLVALLAATGVLMLYSNLGCGAGPSAGRNEPCLGADAWNNITSIALLIFLGAACYVAGRLVWCTAREQPVRYSWSLLIGTSAFALALITGFVSETSVS
jgi:hypothetical protein